MMFGVVPKTVYGVYCNSVPEPIMFGMNNVSLYWEQAGFVLRNNFLLQYACKNIKIANQLKKQLETSYPSNNFGIRKFVYDKIRGCYTACR